jgi:hypothetical protein
MALRAPASAVGGEEVMAEDSTDAGVMVVSVAAAGAVPVDMAAAVRGAADMATKSTIGRVEHCIRI